MPSHRRISELSNQWHGYLFLLPVRKCKCKVFWVFYSNAATTLPRLTVLWVSIVQDLWGQADDLSCCIGRMEKLRVRKIVKLLHEAKKLAQLTQQAIICCGRMMLLKLQNSKGIISKCPSLLHHPQFLLAAGLKAELSEPKSQCRYFATPSEGSSNYAAGS